MNRKLKRNNNVVKAEIIVVFKTCDLMSTEEFNNKYKGNIEKAVRDIINSYSLIDIIEESYIIKEITIAE